MGPCCILKTIKNVKGILPATAHVSTLETRNQPFIYSVASLPHFISSPVYFISFYTHLASLILMDCTTCLACQASMLIRMKGIDVHGVFPPESAT